MFDWGFVFYGARRFHLFSSFQQLIGGQDEESRGKRSFARKSTEVSQAIPASLFILFVSL